MAGVDPRRQARAAPTRHVAAFAVAIVVVLMAAGIARADAQRRVVVARVANADAVTVEALARVTGELIAARFEIVTIPVEPASDQRATVEAIGREMRPVAAFAIFPGPKSGVGHATAEIWVSDRQKDQATVQRMRVDPQDTERSAAVLAVHAVELLKASLADLWIPEAARKPEAPPPPVIEAPRDVPAAPARLYALQGFAFEVAGGLLAQAGGFDPTWTPAVRISIGNGRGLALRLGVAAAGQTTTVANAIGSARLSHQLGTLEGVIAFRPGARLQPFLGVGAGAYRIGVSGVSNDPTVPVPRWDDHVTQSWAGVASAAAGTTIAFTQHVAFVASADALLFLPRPVIALGNDADATVGRGGRPAFLVTGGLVVR